MVKFVSLHVEFWTNQTHPVMEQLLYVDKVCARLWSEYHMYAYKIKEAQTRGMTFELQSSDKIFLWSDFDTNQKHLTGSDNKAINELMSNLFKSDKGQSSNLKYNLTTASRKYEDYCEEREYQKSPCLCYSVNAHVL